MSLEIEANVDLGVNIEVEADVNVEVDVQLPQVEIVAEIEVDVSPPLVEGELTLGANLEENLVAEQGGVCTTSRSGGSSMKMVWLVVSKLFFLLLKIQFFY